MREEPHGEDDLCIPDTVQIADKEIGKDYTVGYNADTGKITLRDLTGTIPEMTTVTYNRVKPGDVTEDDIIGDMDSDNNPTGIKAIETVYQELGVIPYILCCPGWSADAGVHAALTAASQQIAGQWFAFVHSEIPVTPEICGISKAVDWKRSSSHTNECEAPCWPMARKGDKVYHISTLATVVAMQTDAANGGVPFETPSNKPVDVTGYYISKDKRTTFLREQANELNAAGIRTILHNGGRWVLWGPHTGAYGNEDECDVRATFDSTIRMMYHILNEFQLRYGTEIDMPMNRGRIEAIVTETQATIEGYISAGALLYGKMEFRPEGNTASDMAKGKFLFNIKATSAPPARVLTAEMSYTSEGLKTLFGEGE